MGESQGMSEQNAMGSLNPMAGSFRSSPGIEAATIGRPDRSNQSETDRHNTVEYWAQRIMWLLVAVTSLWDIVVTFDRHFDWSKRWL
jgi:hypothetical protein